MIIFLYGEDTFRSLDKLKQLKNRFQKEIDPTGSSIVTLESHEIDLGLIRKVILAPALFAKERFVVFKNFLQSKPKKELQDDMLALLQEYADDKNGNILVFWESVGNDFFGKKKKGQELLTFLKEQKFSQEFKPLTQFQLKAWVQKQLEAAKCTMDQKTLFTFTSMVGTDMWQIHNELQKLISYKQSGPITEQDIELLVSEQEDENIFALLDAVVQKKQQTSMQLLQKLLQGTDGDQAVFNILKWHIGIIAQIRSCLDDGIQADQQIAKLTGAHPFVVKKNKQYAARLTREQIEELVHGILQLEMDIRTQLASSKVLLTRFITSVMA